MCTKKDDPPKRVVQNYYGLLVVKKRSAQKSGIFKRHYLFNVGFIILPINKAWLLRLSLMTKMKG